VSWVSAQSADTTWWENYFSVKSYYCEGTKQGGIRIYFRAAEKLRLVSGCLCPT